MTKNIEKYDSEDFCFAEMAKARDTFGSLKTTRKQYEAMNLSLGRMYLYCPKNVKEMVYATLLEAKMREPYFYPIWRKEEPCTK